MADNNFLIQPEKGMATLLGAGTLNLNVLLRDIVVLETKVAGTMYYEPEEFEPLVKKDMHLQMVREPENKYDKFAVALFLDQKIHFLQIAELIQRAMQQHKSVENPSVDEILAAEAQAHESVLSGI